MASAEERSEHPGPSIYLFEVVLLLSSGAIGFFRIWKDGPISVLAVLVMLGLPAAAAVVAGPLARLSIEGQPRLHWSLIPTLPIMHAAILFALAKLIGGADSGIEAQERIVPALLWTDPVLIVFSAAAQMVAVATLLVLVRKK